MVHKVARVTHQGSQKEEVTGKGPQTEVTEQGTKCQNDFNPSK